MYTCFPPPDAAVILKANLSNLNPFAPDPKLIHSSHQQITALSSVKNSDIGALLERLRQHLISFEWPTVALPGEDEPPNLKDAHTDALKITHQLVAIGSSTKSAR